jgi:membrane protease YdiL (CAAX protease family)
MRFSSAMKSLFTFRWNPGRDTLFAFCLGLAVIGASVLLLLFNGFGQIEHVIGFFIVRDLFQMLILGIALPLWYILVIKKQTVSDYGVTMKNWKRNLIINVILTIGLFFVFLKDGAPAMERVFADPNVIGPMFWLLFGGIFEVFFFYSFIRTVFERAFGVLPSILITAVLYSFHHAGFQPEFGKLILVGVLMASLFRLGGSFLIIFPFFWWLGAGWDVLVNSQTAAANLYVFIWPRLIIDVLVLAGILFVFYRRRYRLRNVKA